MHCCVCYTYYIIIIYILSTNLFINPFIYIIYCAIILLFIIIISNFKIFVYCSLLLFIINCGAFQFKLLYLLIKSEICDVDVMVV